MMNYHAKFNIAECSFNKITNPAFVGIFSYEDEKTPLSLSGPAINIEFKVRRSITIASYVGGGAGFPSNEQAEDILTKEHVDLLEIYVKTIPQDKLYFFEDGTRLSIGMMIALVKIAKKFSKHVICIGIEPDAYEGKKSLNQFKHSWEVINELSDESHIFDFSSSDINRQSSIIAHRASRWNLALTQLANIESNQSSYNYYSNL